MKAEKNILHALVTGAGIGLLVGLITFNPVFWTCLGIALGVSIGTTLMFVEEELELQS